MLWSIAKHSCCPNREKTKMRITFVFIMAAIAALQCSSCAPPHSSGGQDVTITVTVDNFSGATAISTVKFSLTHRQVFYGTSIPMTFDSSAITYSCTIQDIPTGPIDFQIQAVDSGNNILCSLTETYTVSSRSEGTLFRELSDSSCGISPPPRQGI